ncbi:hypothetical protein J6590_036717 [Homalodisca vitripennis]|nr:hypothetical protein J6590_036717 [Homalodisca vitripennis]
MKTKLYSVLRIVIDPEQAFDYSRLLVSDGGGNTGYLAARSQTSLYFMVMRPAVKASSFIDKSITEKGFADSSGSTLNVSLILNHTLSLRLFNGFQ